MNAFNYSVTQQQVSPRSKLLDQRATTFQQKHTVNDYGLLNKAITQQTKKTKRKKLRKPSLEIYSDPEHHCQSLDKLTFLHEQKNHQIVKHIYEKAALQAQNEELKLNLLNPNVRQNELHNKIQQLQIQLNSLAQQMQEKQQRYKKEIEQLKSKHQAQLLAVRQSFSNPQPAIKPSNIKYYQPYKTTQRQVSPPKQVIRTYQNEKRLIVENSNDLNTKTYKIYPQNRENNSKNVQYLSSPASNQPNKIQQNVRTTFGSTTNPGYQNVFIKPQSANLSPQVYSMNPNFVRETDSPKKHTPDTSKNTTLTYNVNKNQGTTRGEPISLSQTNNNFQRETSPQYRNNNVYTYERVAEGTRGAVNVIKTGSQYIKQENRDNKQSIGAAGTKQSVQAGKTGVSERQIDDIYKRYYLDDK